MVDTGASVKIGSRVASGGISRASSVVDELTDVTTAKLSRGPLTKCSKSGK